LNEIDRMNESEHRTFQRRRRRAQSILIAALSELEGASSWNQLIASRGRNIRRLSYSSTDAHDVAYREWRTPLYSYRVGDSRLILTLSANAGSAGDIQSLLIIRIAKRSDLHSSDRDASSVTRRTVETYNATVQYGDWTAVGAADDGDFVSIWDFLIERGLIAKDEFLVGIRIFNGENLRDRELTPAYIHAFAIKANTYEEAKAYLSRPGPIEAREISTELAIPDLFKLFKRFSIAMSRRGLNITGREISTE
jgi:hypothetical protein